MKKTNFLIIIAIAIIISSCFLYSCTPSSDGDDPVTPPVETEKPIVKTVSVTGLSYDSILVTGVVVNNTKAKVTSCGINYNSYVKDGVVSGTLVADTFRVKMAIQLGVPYNVYAFAKNETGTGYGEWLKYVYSANGPKLSSPETIEITDVSGVAMDTVDVGNLPTKVTIYYGSSSVYTDSTVINTYNKKTIVKFLFPGLESGTEHHFCFKAENALKTVKTSDVVFCTGVKDVDGNYYPVTKIGDQFWVAKDLKTTHYNDGSPITNLTSDADWFAARTGAYCYYNNDPEIGKEYGALYNWYSIHTDKLAIKGWHVPTYDEWIEMIRAANRIYDGRSNLYLKEVGFDHWKEWTEGTNTSGFTAIPGGHRSFDRNYVIGFNDLHLSAIWWTADEWTNGYTRILYMDYDKPYIFNDQVADNWSGMSVRIIKDSK